MLKSYLLAIVGVGVLSIIVHLVLPEGKINKNVLFSFSLFVLVVLLAPIIKLSKNFDFSSVSYTLDEEFLTSDAYSELENQIHHELESEFLGARVKVVKNGENEYIFVDLSDLVLIEKSEHIKYYQAIKEKLMSQFGIDDERIVIYG